MGRADVFAILELEDQDQAYARILERIHERGNSNMIQPVVQELVAIIQHLHDRVRTLESEAEARRHYTAKRPMPVHDPESNGHRV